MTAVVPGRPPKALETDQADIDAAFSTTAMDPTAMYADLRQRCPVALQNGGGSNGSMRSGWLLTRYADIVDAARDTDRFGQSIRWPGKRRPPLESNPPEHRGLRGVLQPFFLPKHIKTMEPFSRSTAIGLMEPLLAAGGGDFAEHVARPLPPQVLLATIGLDPKDWEQVKHCCEASYLQSSEDPAELAIYRECDTWLWDYCAKAIADRQQQPRDPATDLITALVVSDAGDGPMPEELAVGTVRLLIAAGHDSTTSAIGICLRFLAENPEVQQTLREEPRRIAAAIEEILRLRAPVLQMPRTVMQETELGGRSLCPGDTALLAFASGNLDDDAFPDAATFKLNRVPNRHLSFGTGIHTCIGNILARQEMLVTLEELLTRTASFELAAAPKFEFWHPHGATSLELKVTTA
jgi:cytochrome P450